MSIAPMPMDQTTASFQPFGMESYVPPAQPQPGYYGYQPGFQPQPQPAPYGYQAEMRPQPASQPGYYGYQQGYMPQPSAQPDASTWPGFQPAFTPPASRPAAQAWPGFQPAYGQPQTPQIEDPQDPDPFLFDTPFDGLPQAGSPAAVKPVKKTKKAWTVISNVVFWAVAISLLGGSLLFTLSNNPKKSYFGFRFYSVLTGSMTPRADGSSPPGGFKKGDTIVVKMCEPENIKVGDIITFNPGTRASESKAYLTHRVVQILNELAGEPGTYFVTRGDANNADDPPITGQMLIGKKVFTLPAAGVALQVIRENFILTIALLASLFGCILMLKWYFARPKKKSKA